jgi:asparagine synthase (glutamine-hydrolysing)
MKLQIGLLHRTPRAASLDDLPTFFGEPCATKADIAGEVVTGPLAIAYRGHRITEEEQSEVQPFKYGPYILSFDGRLDNREELGDRLGLRHLQAVPDPLIAIEGYAQLGDQIFSAMLGEFALCLWCAESATLLFARSLCGARPLYYVSGKERLVWSSDFAHLARFSGVVLKINDAYVLEYLISQPSANHTPFREVHVVPPGSILRFGPDSLEARHSRLWDWSRVTPLRYGRGEDYAEHCLEILKEAVQVRLRCKGRCFAELSGGLDSSSIVLLADRVLLEQGRDASTLRTVSCVYEESECCDERYFISAAEDARNRRGLYINEEAQSITLGLRDIEFTGLPNPLHCFPGRYRTIRALMREHSARLILTGLGGDHLFWSYSDGAPLIADLLRSAKLSEAHHECRTWSHAVALPYVRLLHKAFGLAIQAKARRASHEVPITPSWLSVKHKRDVRSLELAATSQGYRSTLPSEQAQRGMAESLFTLVSAGYFNEYSDLYVSHPFTHRRLVEFCLSIPLSQLLHGSESRSLMRRALKEVLPPKILRRQGKPMLDEALIRAVAREWSDVGNPGDWQVCQQDYVDAAKLSEALNKMRVGIQLREESSLIRVFTLERWLRSLKHLTSGGQRPWAAVPQLESRSTAIEANA